MHRDTDEPALHRQEWDFRACPNEERDTCLHYEYAREFVRGRPDLAARLAEYPRPQPYGHPFVFVMSKEADQDGLPLLCADFPEKPWLSIPQQQRHFLMSLCKPLPEENPEDPDLLVPDDFDVARLLKWDAQREELSAKWNSENADRLLRILEAYSTDKAFKEEAVARPSLCDGPKRYYAVDKDKSYALIKLDWNFSNHQLRKAFDRLLDRCPEGIPGKKNKKLSKVGRGRAGDRLNWLGAKRLHRQYRTYDAAQNAVDAAHESAKGKASYTDAEALRKAAGKSDRSLASYVRAGRFRAFDIFDRVG